MLQSGIFTLKWIDIADAVLTAVVVAVVTGLVALASTNGFDVFSVNWTAIFHSMVNWAFVAGVLSLGKAFLSTNTGSLLGVGPATPVN